ncbi:hypothetical protein EDB83DRAFT_2320838 [Lactarius deliciosus]|nr:hypothetical protein EDB83DRAFT_2320838 [Lactarius deliciosus]
MSPPLSAVSSTVLLLSVVIAIVGQLVGLWAMVFDAALCQWVLLPLCDLLLLWMSCRCLAIMVLWLVWDWRGVVIGAVVAGCTPRTQCKSHASWILSQFVPGPAMPLKNTNTSSGSNTNSQPRPQHLTGEYMVMSTATTAGKVRSTTTIAGKASNHHDSRQGKANCHNSGQGKVDCHNSGQGDNSSKKMTARQ